MAGLNRASIPLRGAVALAILALAMARPAFGASAGDERWTGSKVHNVQASPGTFAVTDDAIAVDPSDPAHLMTAGSGFFGLTCNASSNVGVFNSDDGGRTWRHRCMLPDGSRQPSVGDAWVTYGPDGSAYVVADYGSTTPEAVEIESSADNGSTWSDPSLAVPALYDGAVAGRLAVDSSPGSPHF